jgi:hypothetical protein
MCVCVVRHRASEHAVKAQLSRFVAQQELNEVKKAHWDHFASLSHDEALFSGCLYEAHGPLRVNETLHGALINVTLLGKSSHIHPSTCILTVLL